MAGPLHHADPPAAVQRVELDGLVLLYHRPSGTTHFLASPAPELLDALFDTVEHLQPLVQWAVRNVAPKR